MKRLKILLTNDDGVLADGILAAKTVLTEFGDVTVVAPSRPRSGCGHSITLHKALRAEVIPLPDGGTAYSCSGTPSDCVVLGVSHIMDECDLVVSGINKGSNMGEDLTYSGTVGAAMEGTICSIPSIAISLDSFTANDFSAVAYYLREVVKLVMENGLPHDSFYNVNVPFLPLLEIKGIKFTAQGTRRYEERVEKRVDPAGRDYYWICGNVILNGNDDKESDNEAVQDNYVSITPISLKLTDFEFLEKLKSLKHSDLGKKY